MIYDFKVFSDLFEHFRVLPIIAWILLITLQLSLLHNQSMFACLYSVFKVRMTSEPDALTDFHQSSEAVTFVITSHHG